MVVLLAGPATAAQWLSWPPRPNTQAPVPASAAAVGVRLRIADHEGVREIWVDNDLYGPAEVRIDAIPDRSGFPLHRVLPARGAYRLARLPADGGLRLRLLAVPGAPGAAARDVDYGLPLRLASVRIGQPPQGRFSHTDSENLHAVDFAAPIGTPVVATRGGTVMQAQDRFRDGTGRPDEANLVRILHSDGSMAVYAHLQHGSLAVVPGERVAAGRMLARSGNSGYSSGPHLHFAVQTNAGLGLASVPVRIVGDRGELHLPRETLPASGL